MKKLWLNDRQYIAVSGQKTVSELLEEIAVRPTYANLGMISMILPNPDPVLKRMGKDISTYRELMVDSQVWSTAQSRQSGVLSLEWGIDRGKSKSRVARFVDEILNGLRMRNIMEEILMAVQYGYQPMEVIWEQQGDYIIPVRISGKPQEWFVFDQDNQLRYRGNSAGPGELLPDRKFLIPTYKGSYANPYGEPTLSRCFWPATFKKGGWRFWITFTEKYGMPFIIGKHPRGQDPSEVDALLDMLENMVQDAVAAIPDDSSVDIQQTGGAANVEIYSGLITACNAEISKAEVGHSAAADATPGKLGQEQGAIIVRQDLIESDQQMVEEEINLLIQWIVELNFGEGAERPVFSLWQEEDVDKILAERDEILSRTGVRFNKNYFEKTYGLEPDDFEIAAPAAESGSALPAALRFQASEAPADQAALDKLIEGVEDEDLQFQIEPVIQPVIDLVQKSKNYEDALKNLAGLFPKMKTGELEEMLSRAIFVLELWGRLNEAQERD